MRRLTLTVIALAFATAISAQATSTFCSNPSRAGIRAETTVKIPRGDEPAFAAKVRKFSQISDMSLAEVGSLDGNELRSRSIIFQSPKVSVAILVRTERNKSVAHVTIERTCINDALEDWRHYWNAFSKFLATI